MLIEEAQSISGLSYAQLDEALDLPSGQSFRYSRYPVEAKTRAPQAGSVQRLENRVAAFLKRPRHIVVVENNHLLNKENLFAFSDVIIGVPDGELDLGNSTEIDLQLGYEGDWPTFRRLKASDWMNCEPISSLVKRRADFDEWPDMLALYAWQWGVLWDKDIPWLSRINLNFPADLPIESLVAEMHESRRESRVRLTEHLATLISK